MLCLFLHKCQLKLECKKLAKMSMFSLMIFEEISVSWHGLETSWFKISLNISSLTTSEIEKAACFFLLSFHTSPIVSMLGSFLWFTISLIIGPLMLSEIGSLVTHSGILRLSRMFEKKVFKTWAVFSSFETISFSSINVIFP